MNLPHTSNSSREISIPKGSTKVFSAKGYAMVIDIGLLKRTLLLHILFALKQSIEVYEFDIHDRMRWNWAK